MFWERKVNIFCVYFIRKWTKDWKKEQPTKLKFTYKEQKEYESIEADIEKLESEIAALDADMVKNAMNNKEIQAKVEELKKVNNPGLPEWYRW